MFHFGDWLQPAHCCQRSVFLMLSSSSFFWFWLTIVCCSHAPVFLHVFQTLSKLVTRWGESVTEQFCGETLLTVTLGSCSDCRLCTDSPAVVCFLCYCHCDVELTGSSANRELHVWHTTSVVGLNPAQTSVPVLVCGLCAGRAGNAGNAVFV